MSLTEVTNEYLEHIEGQEALKEALRISARQVDNSPNSYQALSVYLRIAKSLETKNMSSADFLESVGSIKL